MKHQGFKVGDLVLRKVTLATKDPSERKLAPKWESPSKLIDCQRFGAYHLEDMEGKLLPRPWNVEHLRKYYIYKILFFAMLLSISTGNKGILRVIHSKFSTKKLTRIQTSVI